MAGLAAALALLWSVGDQRAAAVAALALFGLAFSAVPTTLGHRVMLIAPGSTDMGMAVYSSTFNLGIAGGSALGAGLTAAIGVRAVPLVSVVLVLLALVCILLEDRIDRGR
jgi:predicted MFS family arabinose efflux permease